MNWRVRAEPTVPAAARQRDTDHTGSATRRFAALAVALTVAALQGAITVGAGAQSDAVPPAVRAAAERITADQLKADLDFLASDDLRGRNTPSPGFDAAAEYLEKRLQRAGVKPFGTDGSYRQPYLVQETTLDVDGASIRIGGTEFRHGTGFTVRGFAGALTTALPVRAVYVGHGWTAPGVDPYRGIDVKGKVVVVHGQGARPKDAPVRSLGRVTIGGTSPVVEAERRGAVAVLYFASGEPERARPPGTAQAVVRRELEPPVPSAYAAPRLTSIQLGEAATRALLEGTALDPASLAQQAAGQAYPASVELRAAITIRLPAASTMVRPFNVVAWVEGADPRLKHEYIVIQSHLDGAVGARSVEGDSIYNAADDNASGSAANLAIAEQLAALRPRRSVVFLWDSGEERGLWGTRQFVSTPPVRLADIVAMVNIDMIGASRSPGSADSGDEWVAGTNEVFVIGPAVLSDRIGALVERVNDSYLKLALNRKHDTAESEFFYPRTDAGPFLERGVLTIGFTTGLHERYHLPADEARFLDPAKMTAIARTVFAVVHALGASDQRPGIEKPIPESVLRAA